MDLASWKAQLRKGAAELAVLAVLRRGEAYGLQLLNAIGEPGGMDVSEGTIYPLLNRLEREGKIGSRWRQEDGAGHMRKLYRLTPLGRAGFKAMLEEWHGFRDHMERLLGDADAG